MKRIIFYGIALGLLSTLSVGLVPTPLKSATPVAILLALPPEAQLKTNAGHVSQSQGHSQWQIQLTDKHELPLHITAVGPFGAQWVKKVSSLIEFQNLEIPLGIETQAASNPKNLSVLPKLCPRLQTTWETSKDSTTTLKFTYLGEKDRLNHRPTFQLLDTDANQGKQALTVTAMDGRNVLLVKKIRVQHDYEDSNHVEYEAIDSNTGDTQTYYEDERGFYANFQYAVVPYSAELEGLDTQTLLHLGQGTLSKINQDAYTPEIRTRSFLPGPYLSKKEYLYELCEWGDTAKHAKEQSLHYQNLALWDWDYPVKTNDKVMLIIWESDEEYLDHNFAHLPKNYLIDDLIAVFTIEREASHQALHLKNARGDFEITVQTGDFERLSL